ncbi:MAG: transcriptional repressor NrdR [Phycisphaerae bacterium]|nr:transcriptional repressor NrdR [Phycisphaerae bacterium]
MRCPYCKADDDKVVDSRAGEQGRVIRRRRQCLKCDKRFTTYERLEEVIKLSVVKKDGSRVPFERTSIIEGVRKACYKRPVSIQQINELAECVEEDVLSQAGQEVDSRLIGRLTLSRLKKLDKVAYIRFASIYLEFQQVDQFIEEAHQALKPDLSENLPELFEE